MNELIINQKQELTTTSIEAMYTNTLGESTKKTYIQAIKEFFGVDDLSQVTIEQMQNVTPDNVNIYANGLLLQGKSTGTINKKLSALQSFYKFLCRRSIGICTYNPFDTAEGAIRFKNAARNYSDKRALTHEEINKMLKAARENKTIIGLRDLIVLELLATTGMRRAEICSIKIGDIQTSMGKKVIEIVGKGNKSRMIVLTNSIVSLINKYLKERELTFNDVDMPLIASHGNRGDSDKCVNTNTIYRIIKRYAKEAGIDESTISPHNLRHTFCTECIDMGYDITDVKDLMGHSSVNTTERYRHNYNVIKNNPAERLEKHFNEE